MNWLIAIIALNLIILLHELGHYLVAKRAGIGVNEFSLFFGPKICGFKKGETVYALRLIPVGAFVALEGEESASDQERAYNQKPLSVRAAVIAAGPLINLLTAVILLTIVFSVVGFDTNKVKSVVPNLPADTAGIQVGDEIVRYDRKKILSPMDVYTFMYLSKGKTAEVEIKRGATIQKTLVTPRNLAGNRYILGFISQTESGADSNVVKSVVKDSPAWQGGVKAGDRIIGLNDQVITNKEAIANYLSTNQDRPVKLKVRRGNAVIELNLTPKLEKGPEQYVIGINFKTERGNLFTNIKESVAYTAANAVSVVRTLAWLITGKMPVRLLSGPVGIASAISEVVGQGPSLQTMLINLLTICANISIALGATNLIPFPALDGARLLVLGLGMIKGQEVISAETEGLISMVGLFVLISLGIYTIINDIIRIIWF